jgi:hypothetical protein
MYVCVYACMYVYAYITYMNIGEIKYAKYVNLSRT